MTDITPSLIEFINNNITSDTNKLLLSAKKSGFDFDINFAIDQILCRKQIKDKLPEWYANKEIIIPSRISAEQCSSEYTARYKSTLVAGDSLCDLTGGMGVDCYYLSRDISKAIYIERFADYCDVARHNFKVLNADNIEVRNGDSREILNSIERIDTFYIDPARRSDVNKRLFALDECEPDIVGMKDELLNKSRRVIVKVSPMADIDMSVNLLPETIAVEVISVKNECKEVIFILERSIPDCTTNTSAKNEIKINCINFISADTKESFLFSIGEEKNSTPEYARNIEKYLYEPNSSIMKAGAFKSVAERFNMKKLHVNSHLYCCENLEYDFPGRKFEVLDVIDFSSKTIKSIKKEIPKANITVRNFPLTVDELRKKTGIKEGGDIYIFATICGDKKLLLISRKAI